MAKNPSPHFALFTLSIFVLLICFVNGGFQNDDEQLHSKRYSIQSHLHCLQIRSSNSVSLSLSLSLSLRLSENSIDGGSALLFDRIEEQVKSFQNSSMASRLVVILLERMEQFPKLFLVFAQKLRSRSEHLDRWNFSCGSYSVWKRTPPLSSFFPPLSLLDVAAVSRARLSRFFFPMTELPSMSEDFWTSRWRSFLSFSILSNCICMDHVGTWSCRGSFLVLAELCHCFCNFLTWL